MVMPLPSKHAHVGPQWVVVDEMSGFVVRANPHLPHVIPKCMYPHRAHSRFILWGPYLSFHSELFQCTLDLAVLWVTHCGLPIENPCGAHVG